MSRGWLPTCVATWHVVAWTGSQQDGLKKLGVQPRAKIIGLTVAAADPVTACTLDRVSKTQS